MRKCLWSLIGLLFLIGLTFTPRGVQGVSLSEVTILSDGYGGVWWNTGNNERPDIAIDPQGGVNVVWYTEMDGEWGRDTEVMYVNYTVQDGWSNVTVVSDGYGGVWWNEGYSEDPAIAIGGDGVIHVVWTDNSGGYWGGGTEYEIFHASYTPGVGWSNATVISDSAARWNTGDSTWPAIAADAAGNAYVVWVDGTPGAWQASPDDWEIMYSKYTKGEGWSSPTVVSDGYAGLYWNTGASLFPNVAVDAEGTVHVVWEDNTPGAWGTDTEVMYTTLHGGESLSNVTVLSYAHDISRCPSIAVAGDGTVHVAWTDSADGTWGTDSEIMYSCLVAGDWTAPLVISDDGTNSNPYHSGEPDICVDATGRVYVVLENRAGGFDDIYYTSRSQSDGWSAITVLSNDASDWNWLASKYPAAAVDAKGCLHVVW